MAAFPSGIATDALLLVGKDRAKSTLTSGIDNVTLSIPVADGTKYLASQVITIKDEQILIASVAVNTITAAERGFAGTAAAAHLSGDDVRGHVTALHHNRLADEVKAIETALGASLAKVIPAENETPSGTIDSTDGTNGNGAFGLAATPASNDAIRLFRNGVLQLYGTDYTLAATTITYAAGKKPRTGDWHRVWYRKQ